MAYFAVKDATGATIYIAATGSGTTGDPYVPTHTFTNALPAGTAVIGKVDQGTGGASAWKVDGSAVTQPVSVASLPLPTGAATQTTLASVLSALQGTLAVSGTFYQVTQPISASALPLPTGAATSANQSTANTSLASIDTKTPALSSGRVPVDGSGVTQPVSALALPLPTGAATAAKQPALGTAGTPSSDVITVQGATAGTALPTREASVSASTSDVHAPASNTAAVVTYAAAGAGVSHVIGGIAWSYSAAPTSGNLKIEDGSGTTVFTMDITAAGAGYITFPRPKKGTANTAMIITLAAGGASVTGKISMTSHYTE